MGPTTGLRLLPLMAGLLLTSIGTGFLVTKWGRYKIFPVVGTALMTLGLFLLSRLGTGTSFWLVSLYLFVLGVGIGGSLQVLVIAVQNAVDYPPRRGDLVSYWNSPPGCAVIGLGSHAGP